MEPLIDIVLEDPRWQALGLELLADRAARATLASLNLPTEGFQIVVMGCDDARIAALNADHRGKTKPTNVLSWPAEERAPDAAGQVPESPEPGDPDDPESLGDIALAYETCATEAADQGKPLTDHVTHLTVHGILHLLGYDHIDDKDAELMEETEVRILATLGLADPY
ncbi:rRNA maturation RNase YbeY [Neogemmobacter tilapiae]|uniref:Endoribonuclease YbeY n=1 Tax=Neogemmobacter tilapiae TaxID=875041 RepID=A0A918THE6_9RHOB|nr:rRNA maturation RNase YbeY [Gemmobacter tilapiae]GHC47928.1 endoribonuclease YbeY [Gemmobacter tilapiae]